MCTELVIEIHPERMEHGYDIEAAYFHGTSDAYVIVLHLKA